MKTGLSDGPLGGVRTADEPKPGKEDGNQDAGYHSIIGKVTELFIILYSVRHTTQLPTHRRTRHSSLNILFHH